MMPGERAETFFERFEVTAGIAEYDLDEKHVIKKLEKAVKTAIIDSIYVTTPALNAVIYAYILYNIGL